MKLDPLVWAEWVSAVSGEPRPRSSDFTYMLESPGDFELRAVLRTFPCRDALFERFAYYVLDEARSIPDAEARELAGEFVAEVKRLAVALSVEIDVVRTSDLEVQLRSPDAQVPPITDSRIVLDALESATRADIAQIVGADCLIEVAGGLGGDAFVAHHLVQPLLSVPADFSSYTELIKAGWFVWVEGAGAFLKPVAQPTTPTSRGTGPSDWPSDEIIEEAFRRRKQRSEAFIAASDPATNEDELKILATHPDEQVRALAARNPRLPPTLHNMLIKDRSDHVVAGLAAAKLLPEDLQTQLLRHSFDRVRLNLAKRPDLTATAFRQLADDPSDDVRLQIAANPETPTEILRHLATDTAVGSRRALAIRDDLPRDIYEQLAKDSSPRVRRALRTNPSVDAAIKSMLS